MGKILALCLVAIMTFPVFAQTKETTPVYDGYLFAYFEGKGRYSEQEQLRFAVVSAEGVRRYDIDSLCMVVFAALCAVHLGRIVAQIVDHGVQRSG